MTDISTLNGIAIANISSFNGVDYSNISNINGISLPASSSLEADYPTTYAKLIAGWTFTEEDGTDSVGSYDLTVSNGSFVSGLNGEKMFYANGDNGYMYYSNRILTNNDTKTVAFWAKKRNGTDTITSLVGTSESIADYGWRALSYQSTVGFANQAGSGVSSSQSQSIGELFHLAITYTTGTNNIKLYYNGSLVSQGTLSDYGDDSASSTFKIMRLGNDYFNGYIGQVLLSDEVFSATEIGYIYNSGAGLKLNA